MLWLAACWGFDWLRSGRRRWRVRLPEQPTGHRFGKPPAFARQAVSLAKLPLGHPDFHPGFEEPPPLHIVNVACLIVKFSHSPNVKAQHHRSNMAQKAKKDRAKSNTAALANLHTGAAAVNGFFLLWGYFFKSRSLLAYIILSIPSFLCQITLEKSGRPKYEPSGALKTAGEDLSAPGLTEYMFDVIWVTWGAAILVALFGNKAWFLWSVVPVYGAYKGFNLLGAARQMAATQNIDNAAAAAAAGNRKQRRAAATS
jgi:hypothetical protein